MLPGIIFVVVTFVGLLSPPCSWLKACCISASYLGFRLIYWLVLLAKLLKICSLFFPRKNLMFFFLADDCGVSPRSLIVSKPTIFLPLSVKLSLLGDFDPLLPVDLAWISIIARFEAADLVLPKGNYPGRAYTLFTYPAFSTRGWRMWEVAFLVELLAGKVNFARF